MHKKLLVTIALIFGLPRLAGAQDTCGFYISIIDPTYVPTVTHRGDSVTLTFTQTTLNSAAANYHLTTFQQAYPESRYEHLLQVYYVQASSYDFMDDLSRAYPNVFLAGRRRDKTEWLFNPNDYGKVFGGVQTELDLINAKLAWNYTKGDTSVVIGISDAAPYKAHDDLKNHKFTDPIQYYSSPYFGFGLSPHGTIVAGMAATRTDNDTGLAGIGFNCRLDDNSANYGTEDEVISQLSNRGRRVVNASWRKLGRCQNTLNFSGMANELELYNEIYENGTTVVVAAGNGNMPTYSTPCGVSGYEFPASFDHNISVSSVGHISNPTVPFSLATTDSNVKDYHERYISGTSTFYTHNHNSRVSLCAPGYDIRTITADGATLSGFYTKFYDIVSGTSLAAPMVSGTVGLMLSYKKCLSPYQIEYVLKKTAADLYSIPRNQPYLGKLGAGRLDAYTALKFLSDSANICSFPNLQTMYIAGIGINTICAPGSNSVNSVKSTFTPIIVNGTPPYTYRWLAIPGNTTTLNDSANAAPYVATSTGTNLAYYLLTVTDASPIAPKVASHVVKVQLKTSGWDLAVRDSYWDMLDEPNHQAVVDPRDWQIWASPDVWNRLKPDGGREHQNPEYFSSGAKNNMYVCVRNVGCASSPFTGAKARLYFTQASTGEKWESDWSTHTLNISSSPYYITVSGEITDTNGITIPALQPGDTFVSYHSWSPFNPQQLPTNPSSSIDICALARIQTSSTAPYGMDTFEVKNVAATANVRRLNNVATRNMLLRNLGHAQPKATLSLQIANGSAASQYFSLQLLNDKDIHKQLAGCLSDYMYATVYLGDLFDRWQSKGALGTYGTVNDSAKSITYDPATPLRLDSVRVDTGEYFPIQIVLQLRDSIPIENSMSTHIHLRQLTKNAKGQDEVYGNVSCELSILADSAGHTKKIARPSSSGMSTYEYLVYPNPVKDALMLSLMGKASSTADVTVTDITGKVLYALRSKAFDKNAVYSIGTKVLNVGVYFVTITDDAGHKEVHTISKTD